MVQWRMFLCSCGFWGHGSSPSFPLFFEARLVALIVHFAYGESRSYSPRGILSAFSTYTGDEIKLAEALRHLFW